MRKRAEERKREGGVTHGAGSGRGPGGWLKLGGCFAVTVGPAGALSPSPREAPKETEGLVPEQSPLAASSLPVAADASIPAA